MSILKPINRYLQKFAFTKREFNALLFMLFALLGLTALPYILRSYEVEPLVPSEKLAIQKLRFIEEEKALTFRKNSFYKKAKSYKEPVYFKFDPNTATTDDWQKMGFSVKQAKIIANYTSKGGHFYKPEDLKKMFVVSEEKYKALAPYIAIAPKNNDYKTPAYVKAQQLQVEINAADSLALEGLRGIGPAMAKWIIKYRQRLGGFYKMEQLKEVYRIDSAVYQNLVPQIKIDAGSVTKININTATFETLKNHPYLSWPQKNALVNYRKQHGDYKSEADLAKVAIMDKATIARILPYLEF